MRTIVGSDHVPFVLPARTQQPPRTTRLESRPPHTSLGGVWVGYAVRQAAPWMRGWQCQDPVQTGKLSRVPCNGFPSLGPSALGKGLESRARSGSGTAPVSPSV
jgi:hypothetical protein